MALFLSISLFSLFCLVFFCFVLFDVKCVYYHVSFVVSVCWNQIEICAFIESFCKSVTITVLVHRKENPNRHHSVRLQSHCGSSTLYQAVISSQTETLLLSYIFDTFSTFVNTKEREKLCGNSSDSMLCSKYSIFFPPNTDISFILRRCIWHFSTRSHNLNSFHHFFFSFFTLLFPKKKRTRFERFNLHCKVRYIDSFDTLFRPNLYKNSMFYIPNETKKKRIVRLVTHSGHLNFHVSFFRCRYMDIFFAFSGRK